jgi:hypothetical protein
MRWCHHKRKNEVKNLPGTMPGSHQMIVEGSNMKGMLRDNYINFVLFLLRFWFTLLAMVAVANRVDEIMYSPETNP